MNVEILKLDGTVEFTLEKTAFEGLATTDLGQVTLPSGHQVFMYHIHEGNKDTHVSELATEFGADDDSIRVARPEGL